MGLTRAMSGDSVSSSGGRPDIESGTSTPQPVPDKSDPFTDTPGAKSTAPFKSNLSAQSTPESPNPLAKDTRPGSVSPTKGTRTPEIAPNANPDKITDEEETKTKLQPGLPTDKAATRGFAADSNGIGDSLTSASAAPSKPSSSTPAKVVVSKPTPAPVSTTAKPATKTAPKSPLPPKTAKSPTKDRLTAPGLAPSKKASTASLRDGQKKSAATSTSTGGPAKKPSTIDLKSSGNGFVKPKVKSPTRPVKLPASLTTHTAASASKGPSGSTAAPPPRSSQHRTSGGGLIIHAPSQRPTSRASISTSGTATTGKTLKRQNSIINGGRPSIGPPPKQNANTQTATKKDYHVDEGFLARMMRPTQSSSNKTTEKAPVTPPRKQNVPATIPKRSAGAEGPLSAQKTAAKIQTPGSAKRKDATPAKAKAPEKDTSAPVAKEIAPVEAQTESAADPLVEQMAKLDLKETEAPTAETIAPEVAQAETSEEAIQLAATSKDTATTPIVEAVEPEIIETETNGTKESVPDVVEEPLSVNDTEEVVEDIAESEATPNTSADEPASLSQVTDELKTEKPEGEDAKVEASTE